MKRLLTLLSIALCTITASAQNNDFGADLSLGLEKKLTKSLDLGVDFGWRTQDNSKRTERWSAGASFDYKLVNSKQFDLKASAGWEFICQQNLAGTEFTKKGNMKVTDRYWRNRHRTSIGLGANYKPDKRWSFSLKESVQYNHYASASTMEYKYDLKYFSDGSQGWADEPDEEVMNTKSSKDRFILRSKAAVQYDIRKCPLAPFVSVDYGCGLNYVANKWKFSVGTDIKLNKKSKLTAFYRFQTENDDDEPNGHIAGLAYRFKF